MRSLNIRDIKDLQLRGRKIRKLILQSTLPQELTAAIRHSYQQLEKHYGANTDVAVRSSATAEDLPNASFAGQQETYLIS